MPSDFAERLCEFVGCAGGRAALIVHAAYDGVSPFSHGREIAASVPGAEFLVLESRNHVLLAHDPAWPVFFAGLRGFVLG